MTDHRIKTIGSTHFCSCGETFLTVEPAINHEIRQDALRQNARRAADREVAARREGHSAFYVPKRSAS